MSVADKELITSIPKIAKTDEDRIQIILTYLNNKFPNIRTRANKTSVLKKLAIQYEILEDPKNYAKITNKELYKEVIEDNLAKGIPNTIQITKFKINLILCMKHLNDPYNLLPYLLFISGRRISELFIQDNFEIKDGQLYIKKIVKKRGIASDGGYPIELIDINPVIFIELYDRFLRMITKADGSQMKMESLRKTSSIILKSDMEMPDFKLKSLRALHVSYHLQFNPKFKNKNRCEAVRDILSHEGMGAIKHYMDRYEIV